MAHIQEQVDVRFRCAFNSYLAQKVIPLLDGKVVRISARVLSHYDQPQFNHLAEVRLRFYYEINFSSDAGVEEAWGELDYDSGTATWTPSRIKPPCVRTLTVKRQIQALMDSHRYHTPGPADCPQCHSTRVAAIIYGVAHYSQPLQADLDSGRSCLGGSWSWDASPQWRCLSCQREWDSLHTRWLCVNCSNEETTSRNETPDEALQSVQRTKPRSHYKKILPAPLVDFQ
jgi:hypothetical protein